MLLLPALSTFRFALAILALGIAGLVPAVVLALVTLTRPEGD